MWKKIILMQICICLFLTSGYIAIGKSGSEMLQKKTLKAVASMSEHYTVSDIISGGKNAVVSLIKSPSVVTGYLLSGKQAQQYGEPIDPVVEGAITSVYAVSGGQVIETGDNAVLGKYIKIQHDGAVSVYGQCSRIYAEEGRHVRRGQVIGSFMQEENNEFYYELIEE